LHRTFLVCLFSEDDAPALQEKGRQLQLMDEIYMKATQVNVHLSPGDEKSDTAVKAVKMLAPAYVAAKIAQKTGVGQEVTRRKYDRIADEVLGKLPPFLVHTSTLRKPD
jgi:hypothetical protein